MLDVSPPRLFRCNERVSTLIEGHNAGGFERSVGMVGPSSFDRINSLIPQLSALEGLLPCVSEADRVGRAQPHLPLFLPTILVLLSNSVAKHPTLIDGAVVRGLDLEIEAAAVGIHSRVLRILHFDR